MAVLEYASPQMTPPRWRQTLYHLRFVVLGAYAALLAAAVWFYAALGVEIIALAIALLILLGLQALFLLGAPQLRWPRPTHRRAMWLSLISGAGIAGLLSFGLFATTLSAFDLWEKATKTIEGHIFWVIAIAWAVWTFVFGAMWAGEWLTGFKKVYRILVAGTILELLITIPVDVQVRKRTQCYCGEGSFFALVIGSLIAVWSFGPGLVLLFLTRRLQRDGYFSLCRKCGCDLHHVDAKRCPQCNARIPQKHRRMVERA